jgi:tripartite ATP-independent transporter DctM subunit
MDFCEMITGRMNGGLAQVNVLLSTVMGGLSGSSLADAAMEAKLLVPEMEKKGYSREFSSVITAVSALITPLIPPGITMILYGCIGNVSVGKLFVSGLGIGLFLCLTLMVTVSVLSRRRGYLPIRTGKLSLNRIGVVMKSALLPLCIPIVIIGGIRTGVFTATEAGSVMVVFAIALGILYRELNTSNFFQGLKETVVTTSSIMLIVAAATVFSWVLTREQIPQKLTTWILAAIDNKYMFLLVINVFMIIVGMFVEGNAASIILIPLLAPVAAAYGIDEIHFAMTYIFNISIGGLTPPLGTVMFVTCAITGSKIKSFIREAAPFYCILLIVQLLITFFPVLSTGLVNLVY